MSLHIYNTKSVYHSSATDKTKEFLRIIAVIWTLSYFFLPNTVWGRISPGTYLTELSDTLNFNTGVAFDVVLTLLFCSITLYFLSQSGVLPTSSLKPTSSKLPPLWLVTSIYLLPALLTLILYYHNLMLVRTVGSILISFCCGLACALLCVKSDRAVLVICFFGLVQGIYTVYYQRMGINTMLSGEVRRAGGTFDDPNNLYPLLLLGLPLAVAQAFYAVEAGRKAFWMLSASIMSAALVLTWYRGSALAAALALTWLLGRLTHNKRPAILMGLSLFFVFLLVAQHRASGPVNAASSRRSVMGHLQLWERGLTIFKNNWITGTGTGVLSIPMKIHTAQPGVDVAVVQIEPKNLLLHWLDELGIAGGVLFVLFIFVIRHLLMNCQASPTSVGLTAAWLALLVAGVFDTPFGTVDRYCGNALVGCLVGATAILTTQVRSASDNLLEEVRGTKSSV